MEAKGYVDYIGGKDFGGKKLWSFRLRGVETWFRTGSVDPKLQKNDHISFQYSEGRSGAQVDVSTIRSVNLSDNSSDGGNSGGSSYKPRGYGGGRSSDAAEKDAYWRNKEARDLKNEGHRLNVEKQIQLQAARNAAIATVDILVRAGALILPEKKGAGAEVIAGKIADLTQEYYESTQKLNSKAEEGFDDDADIPFETGSKEAF